VKKSLFLVLVTAISLALLFTGNIIEDEHYAFDMLSGVMASSGVDVEGFHLEGWAVVRNIGTARSVWEKGILRVCLAISVFPVPYGLLQD
jgi:hypothetical protein